MSIPGVDGCRSERLPSAGGVAAAFGCSPEEAFGTDVGSAARLARTTALCGSVGGGVFWADEGVAWTELASLEVLGLRGFFAGGLAGGVGVGVSRGDSCGDKSD